MTSRWLQIIIGLVAISNGFARPKDDVFPVYRSLEAQKESRYEEKEVNFVPVAQLKGNSSLGVKKWPGGHGNIDSLDDLMLYHMYTNNINSNPNSLTYYNLISSTTPAPPKYYHAYPTPPSYQNTYTNPPPTYSSNLPNMYSNSAPPYPNTYYPNSHLRPSKPSIIIIEEVTRPSYYDYSTEDYYKPTHGSIYYDPAPTITAKPSSIYSNVIHIADRPTVETSTVNYVPIILGSTVKPLFTYNDEYPSVSAPSDIPTTEVPTTTKRPKRPKKPKKPKPNKCPNVNINTHSSISNQNDIKSKCEEITINVDTNLSNNNDVKPQVHNSQSTQILQDAESTPGHPVYVQPVVQPVVQPIQPIIYPILSDPPPLRPHRPLHHLHNLFHKPKPSSIFISNSPVATPAPPTILSDPYYPQSPTTESESPAISPVTVMFSFLGGMANKLTSFPILSLLTMPFFTTIVGPIAMILSGGIFMATIMFPWAFPFLNSFFRRRSNRGRNRFIILRNRMDAPKKYAYHRMTDNTNYLKRVKRDTVLQNDFLKMRDLDFLENTVLSLLDNFSLKQFEIFSPRKKQRRK